MPPPRKNGQATAAELSLVQLQKCFVNLPSSLVNLLLSVDTPIQNVVIELGYRASAPGPGPGPGPARPDGTTPAQQTQQRSIYVGWTGMPSRRRMAPLVGRDGLANARAGSAVRDQEVPVVEIDATFAHTLGLHDGQKVTATIHLDPPLAHTINIEPLTPEDWEMVELHATFLELNLMNQIRAVPNPATAHAHPLTLHLSPTSTANIKVLSLEPPLPADAPFAKVAPDAEVIVAPKTRPKPARSSRENRSVTSASEKKSAASTARGGRGGAARDERKPSLFLRAVDRALCDEWFDEDDPPLDGGGSGNSGLAVWVDRDLLSAPNGFKGLKWATVTLLRPGGPPPPSSTAAAADARKQPNGEASVVNGTGGGGGGGGIGAPPATEPASRIVVQLRAWDDPPNGQTAALSPALCAAWGCQGIVGGIAKLEPASQSLHQKHVRKIKIYPFDDGSTKLSTGLILGGDAQHGREDAVQRIKAYYGGQAPHSVFQGPLTDGLVLGVGGDGAGAGASASTIDRRPPGWSGGLVKLSIAPADSTGSSSDPATKWVLGSAAAHVAFELQAPIPKPSWLQEAESAAARQTPLAAQPVLVGIDSLLAEAQTHLSHASSVLLTGALGAGKTSVAQHVAETLRRRDFFHTTYFSCRKLVNEESRISTIKETLNRLFMAASWGARLGGRALVILDDLDRLCPAETELVVQSEEGRSRQISEGLCAVVRQYAGPDSGVVLLATAQGKDTLHNVVVGGHVVREIVDLKAPDKDTRRKIMETFARRNAVDAATLGNAHQNAVDGGSDSRHSSRPTTADGRAASDDGNNWMMDGASQASRRNGVVPGAGGFVLADSLDFLDVAGETDGFMPGDLSQLVARAKNEALVRAVAGSATDGDGDGDGDDLTRPVPLDRVDFDRARKGFTPTALRNVTLQHSTTTFAAIGGLRETRRVLLETLAYPTTYAPIFAQCPLRLRSGLLLYGYPGCGKTLLASAVAGECGLNFISVKGPEILNKYIGASEKSVRDLFARAQAAKPCVLFFDEFDAIAPKRGHDSTGVTDRVVNQLLTQMDGAEGLAGVYVLAATSRPDLIDPALLRPGRLDKSLLCGFPDAGDRLDIFQALAKKAQVADDVLAELGRGDDEGETKNDASSSAPHRRELARRTEGFSGADLQALVANAQLEAIHDVLHDRTAPGNGGGGRGPDDEGDTGGSRRTASGKKSYGALSSTATTAAPSFLFFRYGEADDDDNNDDGNDANGIGRGGATADKAAMARPRAGALAERAAIVAKLDKIKLARRRERAARRGDAGGGSPFALGTGAGAEAATAGTASGKPADPHRDVVIQWKHVFKALDGTRPSISADERRRLERIYWEFVVGRSGEMRDGQGSMEIGGRTSLM
ncbi:ATPase, AAA-type, core [Niveomyces insectorum RCEF 264]|uniref:Peroxisomal ATPase PEX1 n=1 Tax=Niveomyces insectorum RCEF 264 TaxID=1081102 RepID=A0A167UMC7_9HYPO|nr:ATPase, AAA-type, core [Niveomyces insectorum RCEF 264]